MFGTDESAGEDTDTDTDSDAATGTVTVGSGTGGSPSSTTMMPWQQTGACAAWLECVPLSRLTELDPIYGPTGSCWQMSAGLVEECDVECIAGYNDDCEFPTTNDDDSDSSMGGTTGPVYEECSFEELAPQAESWVEAGEEEGLIPTEIGVILEDYCSCHLTELEVFDVLTPLYYGPIRFHTLDEFHSPFSGNPTYAKVRQRVFDDSSMPPLYLCGEGDNGSSIHSPEYEVFRSWLLASAPDAPTWAEMQ